MRVSANTRLHFEVKKELELWYRQIPKPIHSLNLPDSVYRGNLVKALVLDRNDGINLLYKIVQSKVHTTKPYAWLALNLLIEITGENPVRVENHRNLFGARADCRRWYEKRVAPLARVAK